MVETVYSVRTLRRSRRRKERGRVCDTMHPGAEGQAQVLVKYPVKWRGYDDAMWKSKACMKKSGSTNTNWMSGRHRGSRSEV